jgi:hypothetical protein
MVGYLRWAVQPGDLLASHARIDAAAQAAGRDPAAIQRVLNVGGDIDAEMLAALTLEHGMDTYLLAQGDDPEDQLRRFAGGVVPRTKELVASGRRR